MRNLFELNNFKQGPWTVRRLVSDHIIKMFGTTGNDKVGVFEAEHRWPGIAVHVLHVIAAAGEGWDHVSVSTEHRCPTWAEMDGIKRLFFKDDETAMQLHVPPSDHINNHTYCLHLWRPWNGSIPLPPHNFV